MQPEEFRQMALAFPEAEEKPHFERTSFRTKRIFATLDTEQNLACIMLSEIDQDVFCGVDRTNIYPVPGAWGKQGATYFVLKAMRKSMVNDALKKAFDRSLRKK